MASRDDRVGVLLINVGTPEAPRTREVRRYLREFLSDPRVFDAPRLVRWFVLNFVILPFRPRRSAAAYARIWRDDGRSPLLALSESFTQALQRALGERFDVVLAMRYGSPSIAWGLEELRSREIDRVVVFPLYPQSTSATTGSSIEKVFQLATRPWNVPSLAVVPPFYDHPDLARSFAEVGRDVLHETRPEHVLFSFHGLPERHVRKSDETGAHCLRTDDCCARIGSANRNCYRAQCFATASAIASAACLDPGHWSVSFQSRLGRDPWIRPYTDTVVVELAASGVKRVAVFCPAFVADCLETLEEVGIGFRELFRGAGGEELKLVPSLNAHPLWVTTAADLVREVAGSPVTGRRLTFP